MTSGTLGPNEEIDVAAGITEGGLVMKAGADPVIDTAKFVV